MATPETLVLPALGRPFALGALYDARTDEIVRGVTLWDAAAPRAPQAQAQTSAAGTERSGEAVPDELEGWALCGSRADQVAKAGVALEAGATLWDAVAPGAPKPRPQTRDVGTDRLEEVVSDELEDWARVFKLDLSAQLAVVGGLISVDGAATCLTAMRASVLAQRVALLYDRRTHSEKVEMEHLRPEHFTSPEALMTGAATHVCVEVEYGAQAVVTLESGARCEEEEGKVKGQLLAALKALAGKGPSEGNEPDPSEATRGISVLYHGDVLLPAVPADFAEACRLFRELPQRVDAATARPILVHLLPLAHLVGKAAVPTPAIGGPLFEDLTLAISSYRALEQAAHELAGLAACRAFPSLGATLSDFHRCLQAQKESFTDSARSALLRYRSGSGELAEKELGELLGGAFASPFHPECLKTWITEKARLAKYLASLLSPNPSWTPCEDEASMQASAATCAHAVVLRLEMGTAGPDLMLEDMRAWPHPPPSADEPPKIDFEALNIARGSLLQFVDANVDNPEAARVFVVPATCASRRFSELTARLAYRAGGWEEPFTVPGGPEEVSLAVAHSSVQLGWAPPRVAGVEVEIQWCAEGADDAWRSVTFKGASEGGSVQDLAEATAYLLRVRARGHAGHTAWSQVFRVKTTLKLREEYNLLLLGTTGVGKSTFINSFVNYLTYETLDEAKLGGLKSVLPASFTLTQAGQTRVVQVGEEDVGEALTSAMQQGQSCTQQPKAYVVHVENEHTKYKLRLIDTPGIGDTRGTKQDQDNMQAILRFISFIPELHGILFLLKPNDTRLTVAFTYCIKELLKNLHKSAVENILFVFTNARASLYEPGDTLPVLRSLLNSIETQPPYVKIPTTQDTMFCVDSESFRYLAALQAGVKFTEANDSDFERSWTRSTLTCRRLVHQIKTLGPHLIKETVTLNEARQKILQLAEPLAHVNKIVESKKRSIRDQERLVENCQGDVKKLRDALLIDKVDLEPVVLTEPRTVCSDSACSKTTKLGSESIHIHDKICHNKCGVIGVPVSHLNNPQLQSCDAFNGQGDPCRVCKHGWQKHMHVMVEYKQVTVKVQDPIALKEITSKEAMVKKQQELITGFKKEIKALEGEQDKISKASAKFAHFLANNGILSINDAIDEYINYQIAEQNQLIDTLKAKGESFSANQEVLDGLTHQLATYNQEKKQLQEVMQRVGAAGATEGGGGGISAKEALDEIDALFSLPHMGEVIKKAAEASEKAHQLSAVQFCEVGLTVSPGAYGSAASSAGFGGYRAGGGYASGGYPASAAGQRYSGAAAYGGGAGGFSASRSYSGVEGQTTKRKKALTGGQWFSFGGWF